MDILSSDRPALMEQVSAASAMAAVVANPRIKVQKVMFFMVLLRSCGCVPQGLKPQRFFEGRLRHG
jgi:hypothetical protein